MNRPASARENRNMGSKPSTQERLETLRESVKQARDEKVRLEERAAAKAEEREKILSELKEMGIAEGELDSAIAKLSKRLDEELTKAEQIAAAADAADPVAAAAAAGGEFTTIEEGVDDLDLDIS